MPNDDGLYLEKEVHTSNDIKKFFEHEVKTNPSVKYYRGYTSGIYGKRLNVEWCEERDTYRTSEEDIWFENPYYFPIVIPEQLTVTIDNFL